MPWPKYKLQWFSTLSIATKICSIRILTRHTSRHEWFSVVQLMVMVLVNELLVLGGYNYVTLDSQ